MPVLLLVLLGLVGGIALIALLAILNSLYIVRQSESIVIERLGKYKKILGPGLHLIVPLIDSPRYAYWSYFYDGPRGLRTRILRQASPCAKAPEDRQDERIRAISGQRT